MYRNVSNYYSSCRARGGRGHFVLPWREMTSGPRNATTRTKTDRVRVTCPRRFIGRRAPRKSAGEPVVVVEARPRRQHPSRALTRPAVVTTFTTRVVITSYVRVRHCVTNRSGLTFFRPSRTAYKYNIIILCECVRVPCLRVIRVVVFLP